MKKIILVMIAALILGFVVTSLFISTPNLRVISATIPLSCAIALLLLVFRSGSRMTSLRGTMIILAVSAVVYAALVITINSPSFADGLGRSAIQRLHDLKLLTGGIGIGAVLCSWVSGQWKLLQA